MVGLINYFKKEYFDMTPLDKTKQGELVVRLIVHLPRLLDAPFSYLVRLDGPRQ